MNIETILLGIDASNKSIRNLKELSLANGSDTRMLDSMLETNKILGQALKKQIPQLVVVESGFVKCTACNNYIRFPVADRYNNCPECGQAIKWPGEEEE